MLNSTISLYPNDAQCVLVIQNCGFNGAMEWVGGIEQKKKSRKNKKNKNKNIK
jgi:hypothetical protein